MWWFGVWELNPQWVLLIWCALTLLIAALAELGRPVWSLFWLSVGLALLHLTGSWNMIEPLAVPAYQMIGAFAIGGLVTYFWARFRWAVYLRNWTSRQVELIEEAKAEFLRRHRLDETAGIPPELEAAWDEHSRESPVLREAQFKPKLRHHWRFLVSWAIFWPFSMLGFAFSGVIWPVIRWIVVRVLGGSLQRMADREYEDVRRQLRADPDSDDDTPPPSAPAAK